MCRRALFSIVAALSFLTTRAQTRPPGDFLVKVVDSATDRYGYRDRVGNTVIPFGKYPVCYTDTFRNYAIVLAAGRGFIAIDRQERELYAVFLFDNGPDDPSDGLFRITAGGKIGYADVVTGQVVIEPRYSCAWPFENGRAKVAFDCSRRSDGEHEYWVSDHWFYINRKGRGGTGH